MDWAISDDEAFLAYQLVKSLPKEVREGFYKAEGGKFATRLDEELSLSMKKGASANYYTGGENGSDLRSIRTLHCPLLLFAGRHDFNVNSEVAAEWLSKVNAPSKRLVWFEHSAHLPMTEEPGKFLVSLVLYARPIAERAGDAPPAAP